MARVRPTLAKYELLGGLASGGMADVWLAKARGPGGFEKLVVLKTILPALVSEPQFVEMFFNEARVAAALNHPNCVQIFDVGEEAGTYYIAMEFIEGFALSRILKRAAPLPVGVVARVAIDAATGLDYAHRLADREGRPLGLVHRDVSPDNILVSFGGQTKLVDFGIAKAALRVSNLTRTGIIKGKHGYIAPEHLRGQPLDGRADLFALGIVLYKCLTGRRPFAGGSDAAVSQAVLEQTPTRPRDLNPEIPPGLEAVILRALEKQPEDRFGSARAMRAAIEASVESPAHNDELAVFMDSLWPVNDPERHDLGALAAGKGTDPSGMLLQPSISEEVDLSAATRHTTAERGLARSSLRSRRPWLAAAAGGALGILAVGVVAWLLPRGPGRAALPHDESPAAPPAVVTAPAPLPPAAPARQPVPSPAPVARPVIAVPAVSVSRTSTKPHAARAKAPLGRAWIDIRVSPWAEVRLDGNLVGTTPLPPLEVVEGRHTIDLSNADLGKTRHLTIDLTAGERKTIHQILD